MRERGSSPLTANPKTSPDQPGNLHMWQSHVENKHYYVFNRVNLITSHTAILPQVKLKLTRLIVDRWELPNLNFLVHLMTEVLQSKLKQVAKIR